MKIMLIDDEKEILSSLRRTLELMGHEVDCFNEAPVAATAHDEGGYDFVFVDYLMPETNGIWFMKNIKKGPETRILLMTAFVNRDVISEMMRLGAAGYLIKPFDADEIKMHLSFHAHKKDLPLPGIFDT
jgi:DNA-binding NtrC family response regulator